MSIEMSLATMPQEPKDRQVPEITVNSEILPYFLVGIDEYFPYKKWNFDAQISLATMAPFFERMYSEKEQVYLYQIADRESLESCNVSEEIRDMKVDPERFATINIDLNEGNVFFGDIRQGEYASVTTNTHEYMSDTTLPLLEIHTHPDDVLPSAVDYIHLITKGYDDGRSVTRGIVVLCPNIQILALPNPTTPVLDIEEAEALTRNYSEDYKARTLPFVDRRIKRIKDICMATMRQYLRALKRASEFTSKEIEGREWDGALSQDDGEQLRMEITNYLSKYEEYLLNRQDYLANLSNLRENKKMNHISNVLLLEYARAFDVQLFTSTDMTHFVRATA